MPKGKTHDQITFLCLLPSLAGGYYIFKDAGLTAAFTLSMLITSLFLGPDLDTKSINYFRWGILRFLWIPYRKLIPHRSILSHSFILAPIARILYLLLIISVSLIGLNLIFNGFNEIDIFITQLNSSLNKLVNYKMLILAILSGMLWGNAQHIIADYGVSIYKKIVLKV